MSRVSVKTKAKSSLMLLFKEVELLVCPLIVFCIGYLHHVYFSYDLISPIFVVCSLLSTLLVLAYNRPGFIVSSVLQVGLLLYVLFDEPSLFLEQTAFSLSVVTALAATLLSRQDAAVSMKPKSTLTLAEQKDKLWQELFEARKEITALYSQKEELEAKIAEISKQHCDAAALLEHKIQAIHTEKTFLMQEQEETETDIAVLLDKMREMAERQAEVPKRALEPFEAMYKQLKAQFEDKTQVLNATRKELFSAQEEIEVLKRTLQLEVQVPSQMEKALSEQLKATNKALEEMQQKHADELTGYEEVIQGLLAQLSSPKASGSHTQYQ